MRFHAYRFFIFKIYNTDGLRFYAGFFVACRLWHLWHGNTKPHSNNRFIIFNVKISQNGK